jgi:hypothetical protein
MNVKKLAGIIILAPFMLPLGLFYLAVSIPLAIICFPLWLGLSLVEDESLLDFYRVYFTSFAVFPFRMWLGLEP